MTTPVEIHGLSDDQLVAEVHRLARAERVTTAALVRSLAEMDARRLYLRDGCASLFTWCTEVLHLSEAAAYNRIEVARIGRRYPAVLDALDEGGLTLTAVKLLGPYLTETNYAELLASARHKSKRQIEELLTGLTPVRPIPAGSRETVIHLAPGLHEIRFTITSQTRDKLDRARALLRHSIPNGEYAAIFDKALTVLLEQLERRHTGAEPRRDARPSRPGSRHIPAAVRRSVWRRDGARCAFVGRRGRCTERSFLEFHHVVPFAEGGAATVDNIQLRCDAHNRYEASISAAANRDAGEPGTRSGTSSHGTEPAPPTPAPRPSRCRRRRARRKAVRAPGSVPSAAQNDARHNGEVVRRVPAVAVRTNDGSG